MSAASNEASGLNGQVPFDQMFEFAPMCVAVYQGADHRCVYANQAQMRATGGRSLIGTALDDALPELKESGISERFSEVLRTGETVDMAECTVFAGMSGSQASKAYYRLVLQPWRDPAGDVVGVISFTTDVTSQVEARQRAVESEHHLTFALGTRQSLGIFDWDMKRNAMIGDPRLLQAFGIDPENNGSSRSLEEFLAAIHPDDSPRVAEAVARAIETGEEYEEQYRVTGRAGELRHILAKGQCLRDASGVPERFTGVAIDVTRQHNDAEALRDSEARLRTVMTSLDQGYCIAEMIRDENGKPHDYLFIEVNPEFEQMTGLKDAAGQRILDLVPNLEDKWAEIYGKVAYEGETVRFEDDSEAMGRFFDCFATPVLPYGRFAVVFRDITAERLTKAALMKSEAEFRTITEAMPQLVFRANVHGQIDFFSSSWYEYTSLNSVDALGDGWTETLHPDDLERVLDRWKNAIRTGEPVEAEYRLRHRDGEYRWVLTRVQPVYAADGKITQWLGTSTDIDGLKVAEAQRQLLLGEMNHRVKNTLAMVHAIVSQTLRQSEDLADARSAIQLRIGMMAQAHDRLINSTWTDNQICDVVEAALAPHQSEESRFTLHGPNMPVGSKQALALTMALHELATNATKYGALSVDAGHVEVSWSISHGADSTFTFGWQERGGPPVNTPTKRGFGSRMVEQALAGYFNGEAELLYLPEGLKFTLSSPATGLID